MAQMVLDRLAITKKETAPSAIDAQQKSDMEDEDKADSEAESETEPAAEPEAQQESAEES